MYSLANEVNKLTERVGVRQCRKRAETEGADRKHVGDGSGVVVQLADLAVRKVDDLARARRKRVDALLRTAKRIKLSNTGTSESIQSHRQ